MPEHTHRFHRGTGLPRPLAAALLCLAVLLTGACQATAQDIGLSDDPLADPDRWLSDERWSEVRYGLTIRQPLDATAVPDTAQGDVIRWAQADGTRISLSFARGVYEGVSVDHDSKTYSPIRIHARVDLLKKQLDEEMQLAYAGQVINTENNQVIEVGELGGVVNYFIIKPFDKTIKSFMQGFAILQLDPTSAVILRLQCPQDNFTDAIKAFEAMVHSIEVEDAKAINRRIHGWLQNGEAVLADLTQEDRVKAMRGDRLYRVLEGGKDIGFTRVWQRVQDKAYYQGLKAKRGEDAGPLEGIDRFEVEGNAIFVQSRLEGGGIVYQQLQQAVEAPGEANAYWQTKNAMQYKNDPNNLRAGTWVETGVRGIAMINGKRTDHVQITREGTPPRRVVEYVLQRERDPQRKLRYPSADPRSYPSGEVTERAWPTPKRAFLSPVDAALMPALLPNEEKTYAFAAYHQESSRIDIRMMRVKPNADGGKTVYLRPVLDLSEQVLVFDHNNELISHTYPDGRSLKKTTRQELARIWGVRLQD